MAELKVLISRERIAQRVAEMGAEITRDFSGETVILVGVLKGAAIFLGRPGTSHPSSMQLSISSECPATGIVPARRSN